AMALRLWAGSRLRGPGTAWGWRAGVVVPGEFFHGEILVGIDADLASNLHSLLRDFACWEVSVLDQGPGRCQRIRAAAANGGHAAVGLNYVARAADQESQAGVRNQQQGFQMTQDLVSPPVFGQLHRRPAQLAMILLQL